MDLSRLMTTREEIATELIEAQGKKLKKLQQELQEIEQQIELNTGKTIEEIEVTYYRRQV
jgi:predicted  nucleic acid-binding Zn-ribbon protein